MKRKNSIKKISVSTLKSLTQTFGEEKPVLFVLIGDDALEVLKWMGYKEEDIEDWGEFYNHISEYLEWGLENWSEVMEEAIRDYFTEKGIEK